MNKKCFDLSSMAPSVGTPPREGRALWRKSGEQIRAVIAMKGRAREGGEQSQPHQASSRRKAGTPVGNTNELQVAFAKAWKFVIANLSKWLVIGIDNSSSRSTLFPRNGSLMSRLARLKVSMDENFLDTLLYTVQVSIRQKILDVPARETGKDPNNRKFTTYWARCIYAEPSSN